MKSLIGLFYLLILLAGCAYGVRYDGPYEGRIVDADTGQPIEGVVVLGVWNKEIITPGGATNNFYDAMETVTDNAGNFSIKGLGLLVMSNVIPMDVLIFKAGYEYIGLWPWVGLKSRGWKGYEESYDNVKNIKVSKAVYDPKIKVKWEGEKVIIPLKKLTIEERKKRDTPDFYIGERYDKKENITHSCLPKNIKLLPSEVNKELVEQGRKPYNLEGGRCEE